MRIAADWKITCARIGKAADTVIEKLSDAAFQKQHENADGLTWIEKAIGTSFSTTEIRMVKRRVIVAELLSTVVDWRDDNPVWNDAKFNSRLPGKEKRDRERPTPKLKPTLPVYDVVKGSHEKIWLKITDSTLLGRLLPEEYEWLKQRYSQTPDAKIYECLDQYHRRAYPDQPSPDATGSQAS